MSNINLKGLGVALITPFKEDEQIDFDAIDKLIHHQIVNKTDYLVVLGTTAETPTLSEAEKKQILEFVVKTVNGRMPIVYGIGGNNTKLIAKQIEECNFDGVDAILSVTPYYNKPSQEGIYQHFKAIAEVSPLPIILYNVPARTAVNMSVETTLRLANAFPNIIAIKEASGNLDQIKSILKQKPASFEVIAGDDGLTIPIISMGGAGIISVLGNAFPQEFGHVVKLALSGDIETASRENHQFDELLKLLFVDGNPSGIKGMLHVMGYINNKLRLPLVPVTDETLAKMKQLLGS